MYVCVHRVLSSLLHRECIERAIDLFEHEREFTLARAFVDMKVTHFPRVVGIVAE